jgi:hypothetical protein
VVTGLRQVTHKRESAEAGLNSATIGLAAVHRSAALAQKGDYLEARVNLISNMRLLQRGMLTSKNQREYINFIKQSEVHHLHHYEWE